MRIFYITLTVFLMLVISLPSHAERFLRSPLRCADTNNPCAFPYTQDVYTPGIINSVLDHSLIKNPATGNWPYGKKLSNGGGDGIIYAFNGEQAVGTLLSSDQTCVYGRLWIKPTLSSPDNTALVNGSRCGINYASYDEHPGYDYRASYGVPIRAAAPGVVVAGRCILNGIDSCIKWGYVGIDHGNGYITQYGHMSAVYVSAGNAIAEGQIIGLVGHTGLTSGDHLHFEVLRNHDAEHTPTASNTIVVDPYGWSGTGVDPLVNASYSDPRYKTFGIVNTVLWADRCDLLNMSDSPGSGVGVPYDVFSVYKSVLLKARCDNTSVRFQIGTGLSTQYIFNSGYEWRNNAWHKITYTGEIQDGNWLVGNAEAIRARTLNDLQKQSYFLAYVCTKIDGVWKCGCRDRTCSTSYWQMQSFQQNFVKRWP